VRPADESASRWSVHVTLRVKDVDFEVDQQRSEFFAYIPQESPGQESPGRLCWSLDFYCVKKENARGISAPYLYANEMTFDVRDWRSIKGKTVQNVGTEGLAAYVDDGFVNERTANNSIRFLSRQGEVFAVEWECQALILSDAQDSAPLPLRLDAEIAFKGVQIWWVKADFAGLAAARELVGRHIDLACLQEPEIAGPYHIVFPPR
jgi:hypothetical protein